MSKPQESRPDHDSSRSPSVVEIVMMIGVLCAIAVLMLMVVAAM